MTITQILAVKTKGVKCSITTDDEGNLYKLVYNELFNGGRMNVKGGAVYWIQYAYGDDTKKIENVITGHCRESQADLVFMFLVAALMIATALMLFLKKRKGY
jgi:hypothetical protein